MRLFTFLFIFCFSLNASAQGVHFSDNREIPMQLNPAFTGIIHNEYVHRVLISHRRQGNAILGRDEFETYYASYDRKIGLCNFTNDMFLGVGIELFHDQVGTSFGEDAQFFHRQEANLNTSLGIKLNGGTYLIAGFRTGALSYGLSDSNLSYDSQFDGRDYDATLPSLESFSNNRVLYFDIGAGLILRGILNDYGNGFKNYELGVSFMHLNNKKEKFLMNSIVEELGKEYRFHGKTDIQINEKTIITPSLILFTYAPPPPEGGVKEWQIRPSVEFPFLKNWRVAGGVRVSNFAERAANVDAAIFTMKWKPYADVYDRRFKKDNLIVGLSIDVSVSPLLVKATRGYGAFEVFVTKYFTGSNDVEPCCPWRNTKHDVFY